MEWRRRGEESLQEERERERSRMDYQNEERV